MGYADKLGFHSTAPAAITRTWDSGGDLASFKNVERNAFQCASTKCVDGFGIDRAVVEARVSSIIDERRARSAFFPNQLFSDPAWEIMLALTLAHARQHRLDVTNLIYRVDVSSTTVLRWISTMVDEGILIRLDDFNDRRRKYIELTPQAWAKMGEYVYAMIPAHSRAA